MDDNRTQNYIYDSLNRIQQGYTNGTNWGQTFTIDPWGNLTNIDSVAGKTNPGALAAAPATAKNQLTGYTYDAAGNLTNDGSHSYTYDAENRITGVDGGGTATYVYDAEGNRAQKTAGATVTQYVLDTGGSVLQEVGGTGVFNVFYIYFGGQLAVDYTNSTTYFIHPDHLGSTRLMTTVGGTVYDNMDYLPYGEQVAGDTGTTHKFTGKERDAESGLDMFGARYYGSSLGRFMTPDWAAKPTNVPYASFGNPQSLNLYSYVNNNPTTTRDPDGHCLEDACVIEGGIVVTAMAVAYLSSPPGQQMLHNAANDISSIGSAISGFFHPSNSGQNAPPPPTTPTSVSQGTPGTTATNVATGTPASTSQQGAVDNSAMESRSFSPGVKAGADANAGGKCEYCGVQTVPSQQSQAGVTTPSNARQTDHYIPSSQGGSNTADNAVNSCASCNNAKSNTQPQGTQYQLPRMQKPPDQQ